VAVIEYAPGIVATELDPTFRATLEDFAARCGAHRYNVPIYVTSGYRAGDKRSHGLRAGVDIRTNLHGWKTPDKQLQLQVFLAAVWAETVRDHGYANGQWGFGAYPIGDEQPHAHLDVRPHVKPDLYAAVWVGAE
jgi:hypothetical protein